MNFRVSFVVASLALSIAGCGGAGTLSSDDPNVKKLKSEMQSGTTPSISSEGTDVTGGDINVPADESPKK